MSDDEIFMKRCLALASIAKLNGKTAVGSIVVKNNEIIAEGIESSDKYPTLVAHAEIVALLNAVENTGTKDLRDCIMYTTVEPCFMCTYLIRETKIKEIVFGVPAGQIGGSNPEFPLLSTDKITRWSDAPTVRGGVLKEECEVILRKEQ